MSPDAGSDGRLDAIRTRLREFAAERDWSQFHDPKNLAMAIASEAGELLSELRWVVGQEADAFVRDANQRVQIENEIADVAITLLLFCDRAGIDLLDAVERKIDINATHYPVVRSIDRAERPRNAGS